MDVLIDLTEMKSEEITEVLNSYPNGCLTIKFERVFWSAQTTISRPTRPNTSNAPPQRRGGLGFDVEKASNTFMSMINGR